MTLSLLLSKSMKSSEISGLLRQLVEQITFVDPECEIYLFGSAARGEMTTASDFDLCAILSDSKKPQKFLEDFYKTKGPSVWPLDLLVFTQTQFNTKKNIGGVCMIIAEEGIELYPNWRMNEPVC